MCTNINTSMFYIVNSTNKLLLSLYYKIMWKNRELDNHLMR